LRHLGAVWVDVACDEIATQPDENTPHVGQVPLVIEHEKEPVQQFI
jgi:hypothetical protein